MSPFVRSSDTLCQVAFANRKQFALVVLSAHIEDQIAFEEGLETLYPAMHELWELLHRTKDVVEAGNPVEAFEPATQVDAQILIDKSMPFLVAVAEQMKYRQQLSQQLMQIVSNLETPRIKVAARAWASQSQCIQVWTLGTGGSGTPSSCVQDKEEAASPDPSDSRGPRTPVRRQPPIPETPLSPIAEVKLKLHSMDEHFQDWRSQAMGMPLAEGQKGDVGTLISYIHELEAGIIVDPQHGPFPLDNLIATFKYLDNGLPGWEICADHSGEPADPRVLKRQALAVAASRLAPTPPPPGAGGGSRHITLPSSEVRKRRKVTFPKDWGGDWKTLEKFLDHYREYCRESGVDSVREQIMSVGQYFTDKAHAWWIDVKRDTAKFEIKLSEWDTWEKFEHVLKAEFQTVNHSKIALDEMHQLRQGSNLVKDYYREFNALYRLYQVHFPEGLVAHSIVDILQRGIRPEILEKVRHDIPGVGTDPEVLIKACDDAEAHLAEVQRRRAATDRRQFIAR